MDLTHFHPFGNDLPSQRISELLGSITESTKMEFFRASGELTCGKRILGIWHDLRIVLFRTHQASEMRQEQVRRQSPQIYLGLLYGEKSRLPAYYRKLAGNTADIVTMRKMKKLSFCHGSCFLQWAKYQRTHEASSPISDYLPVQSEIGEETSETTLWR